MGNGAKLGLTGVLALIVLLVAVWDKKNEELGRRDGGELTATRHEAATAAQTPEVAVETSPDAVARSQQRPARRDDVIAARVQGEPPPPPPPPVAPLQGRPYPAQPETAGTPPTAEPVATPVQPVPRPAPVARPTPAPRPVLAERPSSEHEEAHGPGVVEHTFTSSDTLFALARKYLGNGSRWREIFEANRDRIRTPETIPIGTRLRIPQAETAARSAPVAPAPRAPASAPVATVGGATTVASAAAYVVKSGDTLSSIAERLLGSATRAIELYEANKDRLSSPDMLREGQKLLIPAGGE